MVNIIIPAYNAHKTIRQAVASVAVQDNQDEIKLTIVDDCSDEPYDYLLGDFKYLNMNILKKPFNSGPGQTRQYGIDRTDCEYLMFLDSDDCLYFPAAVNILLSNIKDTDYDVVAGCFIEETPDNSHVLHSNDINWMHGKLYRTQYLKKHNIKFNKTRCNEDSSFNAIILYNGAKIHFVDIIAYIWKYNRDSITRAKNFLIDSMDDYVANAEYTVSECFRLKAHRNNIFHCIAQYLVYFYVYYMKFVNEKNDHVKINRYMAKAKRFYGNIPRDMVELLTNENLGQIFYANYAVKNLINSNFMMHISFHDFLNLLKNPMVHGVTRNHPNIGVPTGKVFLPQ